MFKREEFNIGNWAYKLARKIEDACSRLVLQKEIPTFEPLSDELL